MKNSEFVFLRQDDKDEYNGIGVGIYPAPRPAVSESEADKIRLEQEVIERVYGPSETAAWDNARLRCHEAFWIIAEVVGEVEHFVIGVDDAYIFDAPPLQSERQATEAALKLIRERTINPEFKVDIEARDDEGETIWVKTVWEKE